MCPETVPAPPCHGLLPFDHSPPALFGDILDNATRLDLPSRSTRPVWIDIDVPTDAPAGIYRGKVTAISEGSPAMNFELELEVLPLRLPPPSDWAFELDLWQNPWAVARYHNVTPWSEEHILLLKPLLRMLAEAGQKVVTTTIMHYPWNAQTYDPYPSMVEWIRRADGSWRWDYSIFDRYVDVCAEVGISRRINCYSMVAFRTNAFRYFDESTGAHQYVLAEPGTEAYRAHWTPFLQDFEKLRIVSERLSAMPAGAPPPALLGDIDAALGHFNYEQAQQERSALAVANTQAALLRASRWLAANR